MSMTLDPNNPLNIMTMTNSLHWKDCDSSRIHDPNKEACRYANGNTIHPNHQVGCLKVLEGHAGECLVEGSEGKNSYRIPIPYRFDLIPPIFLRELSEVYEEGSRKYGDAKYLEEPLPNSVIMNHLINHILLWWAGDRS